MSDKNYTLLFMVLLFAAFVILVIVDYFRIKKRQQVQQNNLEKELQEQKQKINNIIKPTIPIQLYQDVFSLFRELLKYTASVKEIINLMNMNAEVSASIVSDYDKGGAEYVSYNNLLFWYESYMRQLILFFTFVRDVFNSMSHLLEENARNEFVKQIAYVGNFIYVELKKGVFTYE